MTNRQRTFHLAVPYDMADITVAHTHTHTHIPPDIPQPGVSAGTYCHGDLG